MLDETVRSLAAGPNFGALTTFLPDGQASTQIVWVDADEDHVLVNTETGRQKLRNVTADPRVTITIWEAANPYHYVEVRGRVVSTVTGRAARAHIDRLSVRYTGSPYTDPIPTERVILQIAPSRQRISFE